MRDILISPDGNSVAIRGDAVSDDAWNAWGVFNAVNGGHWSKTSELWGWTYADSGEVMAEPEPEIVEDFPPAEPMEEV